MVTEEQKKIFSDFLNNTFNETIKSNEETYKKTSQWIKNVYYKYIHDTLPEEHKKTLEKRLKRRKITMEDFLKTKGNIDSIQELSKEKKIQKKEETKEVVAPIEEIKPIEIEDKTPKEEIQDEKEIKIQKIIETAIDEIKPNKKKTDKTVETKEELLKKLDELDKKYFEIDDKIRSKQKRVFNHITDEEYENKKNELNEIKKQRLEVNRKLDAIKVEEEKPKKEKEAVNKKFEELVNQSKEKDKEISELKNEISKYKEERSYIKTKYEEEYDKRFEIYSTQLKEEYDKKLENEVEKQISKANQKSEKTLELQKAHILRMLLKNETVSIDEIKMKLESHKVSPANLDVAINELRVRIPGITKFYDLSKQTTVLSINTHAIDRWNALKQNPTCPRISDTLDGKVKFLEHTDLHLDLKSTEDQLKKLFEPIFDCAIENDNEPIINLGDLVDTLKEIEFDRWHNNDKEAIDLAIKFFKNFAKVLATVPEIKYYFLAGNHEKHIYDAGIDILEIINDYCNNLIPLGANKGSFMVGNDKIGVFHDLGSASRTEAEKKVQKLSKDYIYSLIAHYHQGMHKPVRGYSLVDDGINTALAFAAYLNDGSVKHLDVMQLMLKNNKLISSNQTLTELYNSDYQYVKKSQ